MGKLSGLYPVDPDQALLCDEVMYVVDGIAVNDALFNNQIVSVNKYSVEE